MESLLHLVSFAKKYILISDEKTVLLLISVAFFNFASYEGERALTTLFLKRSPLNFKAEKIVICLVLYRSNRAFGSILLALVIDRYTHISDYTLMFIGTLSKILKYTVLSLSTSTIMVYLSTVPACPASFMSSAVRSKLTKLVSTEEFGVILSFVGLVSNLSVLIMAMGANGLFSTTAKLYSGLSMMLMSISNVIALIILCYVICKKGHDRTTSNDYHKLSMNNHKN